MFAYLFMVVFYVMGAILCSLHIRETDTGDCGPGLILLLSLIWPIIVVGLLLDVPENRPEI